jgi:hypothetical protein
MVRLDQNRPNPFTLSTVLHYYLPENMTQAEIVVYDNVGRITMRFGLKNSGEGYLSIAGKDLQQGIYLYSLVVDGRIIATKKMVR